MPSDCHISKVTFTTHTLTKLSEQRTIEQNSIYESVLWHIRINISPELNFLQCLLQCECSF